MQEIKLDFKQWISSQLKTQDFQVLSLPGDASFRSYFRIMQKHETYIAMSAPPGRERTEAFVNIAKAWNFQGLTVPEVISWEPTLGFALLSDFGDTLLLDVLTAETADGLYYQAMETLLKIQKSDLTPLNLPQFDEIHIRKELSYFLEWFLTKLLVIEVNKETQNLLNHAIERLIEGILFQPKITLHRDYHSRNLMVLPKGNLGIIDFQDAMIGPITYDLVSLLKDCYINWPREKIENWVKIFYEMISKTKALPFHFEEFLQWFDWVGLKRHLRVLGIFSRLKLRDNKPQYLGDMPRIMNYILEVTQIYPDFFVFHQWLKNELSPRLEEVLSQEKIPPYKEKVA